MGHSELTLETLQGVCGCGGRLMSTTVMEDGKKVPGHYCLGCRKITLNEPHGMILYVWKRQELRDVGIL